MDIKIKFKTVESSNVAEIGYNEEHKHLVLRFLNKSLILYKDVPKKHYDNLLESPSIGNYLHRNIKGKYKYERIE